MSTPREPWCVIAMCREQRVYTMRLPEQFIDRAVSQGWRVLIRDSEMPQPPEIEPSQSGPRIGED